MTPGHHRRARALASLGLLAAILAVTAWFVRRNWAEFAGLQLVNPRAVWPLLAVAPLTAIAIGLQLRCLVRPFGVRLEPREWFGLAVITSFYNILTPFRGGMLAKAAYLHRRHELSLSGFLAVTAGNSIVNVSVAGIVGLCGLLLSLGRIRTGATALAAFFGAMTVATLALMAFAPRLDMGERPLLARAARIVNGWRIIRDDTDLLALTFLATGIQYLLNAAAIFLSFVLIGVQIGAGTSLLLASLTMLSVFVGITPAGLGVVEAIAVVGGVAVGITPAQSLAAAVARRLVTTGVFLALGPCFTLTLLRGHHATVEKVS